MNSMMSTNTVDDDEIRLAQAEVDRTKAELARSLRAAEQSGEQLARRIGHEVKPAVIGAVAVAGAAAALVLTVALVRRGRRRHWLAPAQPSALATAAKTAGLWALRLVARRVALEVAGRLSEAATPVAAPPLTTATVPRP
jgi:hypothetical protein